MAERLLFPEGTRYATVGVGTFIVSLCAVLWVLLCVIGRVTGQSKLYFVGGAILIGTVIFFVASPKSSGPTAEAASDMQYSTYYASLGGVAAFTVLTAAAALLCGAYTNAFAVRRAKLIPE